GRDPLQPACGPRRIGRREDEIRAIAGHEHDSARLDRALREAVVAPELDERVLRQTQRVVAGARGVDDAPTLLLALPYLEPRANLAVDKQDIAFAAEQISELAAGILGQELPVLVERHVREHEHEVVTEDFGVGGILDDERAVKTPADLRGGVDVRVVPERAGVARDEVVNEL